MLQVSRPLRQLTASNVSRLVKVSGIIVSAQSVRSRATAIRAQCVSCHMVKVRACMQTSSLLFAAIWCLDGLFHACFV
jgi:DNA replicative helicase MCM subunit Mcm2 (Cdc46/Mcm family)